MQNGCHLICPLIFRLYSQTLIKADEELSITYTNLMRGTSERRARLQYQWHFKCQCQRCQDPKELGTYIGALKCPHCREGGFWIPITKFVTAYNQKVENYKFG